MKKMIAGLLCVMLLLGAGYYELNQASTVSTIAGTGSHGYSDYGLGQFNLPMGVFSGEDGALYVLDTYNNLIRRICPEGEVQRIAGDILVMDEFRFPQGFYRGGELEEALFNRPVSGVRNAEGNIFITDRANHVIRKIAEGEVFVFAGGSEDGGESGHKDAQGIEALFYYPTALAIDENGNLYVADTGNNAIRRIDTYGNVTTIAGVPGEWGFYDGEADKALFNEPMGIAIREDGVIFVADTGNHQLRVIENGQVRTFAGWYGFMIMDLWGIWAEFTALLEADWEEFYGLLMELDEEINEWDAWDKWIDEIYARQDEFEELEYRLLGEKDARLAEFEAYSGLYFYGWDWLSIGGFIDGYPKVAMFNLPMGMAFYGEILIVADSANHAIRAVFPSGEVVTLAGRGYPGNVDGYWDEALFHFPRGVYVLEDRLIVVDTGNNSIRQIYLPDLPQLNMADLPEITENILLEGTN